jgi:hypothetical protein
MDFKEIFKSFKELPKECYLCGARLVKPEEDHLPPKCIFPRKYWSRLISVPICGACHDKRDKDDEYFRDYISIWCGKNVPTEVHEKRQRSWNKHPTHEIGTMRNLSRVWIEQPSDLIVPGYALKGEMKRIIPVLECIAKGHYFSYKGVRIPRSNPQILMTKAPFFEGPNDPTVRFLSNLPVLQEVIQGMFKFKTNSFRDGKTNTSNWLLEFYDTVQFFIQFSWIERRIDSIASAFPKADMS